MKIYSHENNYIVIISHPKSLSPYSIKQLKKFIEKLDPRNYNGAIFLGLESPGHINRRIIESRAGWTETAIYLYLLRAPLTLLLYRYGEAYALNPAEKLIFRLCIQDKARHIAYGMSHIRYAITERGPDVALGLLRMMAGVEQDLYSEMKDPVLWEA